jgi:hypothetical protein
MDPQQQQQMQSMMAGFGAAVLIVWVLILAFLVVLFWRIFAKAGMAGALGLIAIIPGFGFLICLCILAFSQWRVVPVAPGYAAGMTPYPQPYPPQYPPSNYPPAGPPTQL